MMKWRVVCSTASGRPAGWPRSASAMRSKGVWSSCQGRMSAPILRLSLIEGTSKKGVTTTPGPSAGMAAAGVRSERHQRMPVKYSSEEPASTNRAVNPLRCNMDLSLATRAPCSVASMGLASLARESGRESASEGVALAAIAAPSADPTKARLETFTSVPPVGRGGGRRWIYCRASHQDTALHGCRPPPESRKRGRFFRCQWPDDAARVAGDLSVHAARASPRLVDEQVAHDRARTANAPLGNSARGDRLGGCADRRRGGGRAARARRRWYRGPRTRAALRRAGGRVCRRDGGGTTRSLDLPVAAPRPARPARQRDDPREGADARSLALRGLRVLRQAHARAPRGLGTAVVARDAKLRPGAECNRARELWHAARTVFALGGGGAAAGRASVLRRRGQVLRRRVSALPLALARDAH